MPLESALTEDLSQLAYCTNLKELDLVGISSVHDVTPLTRCRKLKKLSLSGCPLIHDLTPLSALSSLTTISCVGISMSTSLIPLASCTGLKELTCHRQAVDLEELKRRRPDLKVDHLSEPLERCMMQAFPDKSEPVVKGGGRRVVQAS